jgi:hypothetical protein
MLKGPRKIGPSEGDEPKLKLFAPIPPNGLTEKSMPVTLPLVGAMGVKVLLMRG